MLYSIAVFLVFSLINSTYGRDGSAPQTSTTTGGYGGSRQGTDNGHITTYNWHPLSYDSNTPITASQGTIAGNQLQSASQRPDQTIQSLALAEISNAQQGKPVSTVYWVVEDFKPNKDGSIKARTNQIAGGGGYNYAQPLFRVGLDPSLALKGYIEAKKLSHTTQTYSVVKIDIDCVNQANVNKHPISVYTHSGPTYYHLTYNPATLGTIWDQTRQDLDKEYERQMNLIIPQNCYQEAQVPTSKVSAAINSVYVIDSTLTKHGLTAGGGRGAAGSSKNNNAHGGRGKPDTDDESSEESSDKSSDESNDDDDKTGDGYRRLFAPN